MSNRKINTTSSVMKKTTISLPKDLHKQLLHAKADEERDMQEIVADALRRYFKTKRRASNPEKP